MCQLVMNVQSPYVGESTHVQFLKFREPHDRCHIDTIPSLRQINIRQDIENK